MSTNEMTTLTMQVPKVLKVKIRTAAASKDWPMQREALARLEASFAGEESPAVAEVEEVAR